MAVEDKDGMRRRAEEVSRDDYALVERIAGL